MSLNVGHETYSSLKGMKYTYITDKTAIANTRFEVSI